MGKKTEFERLLEQHERLDAIVPKRPEDWEPWGRTDREMPDRFGCDCSMGCRWYFPLAGDLGYDWGVCANPTSHRVGLLTFEHQGCDRFEH